MRSSCMTTAGFRDKSLAAIPAFLVAVLVTSAAFAQGIGSGGPVETNYDLHPRFQLPEDPFQWGTRVGAPEEPISIELDPQGSTWQKVFHTVYPDRGFWPGDHVFITEYLVVAGSQSWTGWQQTLNLPTFDWLIGGWIGPETSVKVNGSTAPGLTIQRSAAASGQGARLTFSFDPIAPGSQVTIVSEILYSGAGGLLDPLVISEVPLPEPCSAVGFVVALLLFNRRGG
jgi:hypothetical protein